MISKDLGLSDQECTTAERAAYLSKADLATNMVVEMTSLQGTIGKFYALRDGETPQVAQAIEEHYMPRQAGGKSPQSKPGVAVAIADRLDSIVGLFAVDMAPTGTKDPFGLRRAAIGLVQNLIDLAIDFNLLKGIEIAADSQPVPVTADHRQSVFDFIIGRLQNMLLDTGYRYDAVNAVLAAQGNNPAAALRAVQSLEKWAQDENWNEILPAFSRCVRITRDLKRTLTVDKDSLTMQPTKDLLAAVEIAEAALEKNRTIDTFVNAIKTLTPTINMFFDQVLVMDKDEQIKNNRLAILQRVSRLSADLADLSHMEGF